jgi:microcystin-dependent protein
MKKQITLLLVTLLFAFSNNLNAQDPYLGDIKLTAVSFTQQGWAECNGQLLPIAQNTALFSLLGTTYGGDGETTFGLPDLRGRVPVGQGTGPGLTPKSMGQTGGLETTALTIVNMPSHRHTINAVTEDGNQSTPGGHLPAGTKLLDKEYSDASPSNATMNASMVNYSGGSQPANNIQPYVTVRYVIATQGIYPSQN